MYQLQKKLLFAIVLFFAISCNNSSGDKDTKTDQPEKNVSADYSQDASLSDWLKGKVLTADESKDYHNFKLYTDGTCEDKGGAQVNWTIESGKLNLGGIMKIAIEKKDDTTLILHRSLSDEIYRVSPL
jgi:hypothetical protein